MVLPIGLQPGGRDECCAPLIASFHLVQNGVRHVQGGSSPHQLQLSADALKGIPKNVSPD